MKVLVACEFSGIVRDAFIEAGHDAISCDLIPSERPGPHIQGDVLDVIYDPYRKFDLMVAHPPCTHLAVSGARWFKDKQKEQAAALNFVRLLLEAPIERIALENPIGIISSRIRKPDQIIQPWMFGHAEAKATCLWLRGLRKLTPTKLMPPPAYYVTPKGDIRPRWDNQTPSGQNKLGPSDHRAADRSRTYEGIAKAMAAQWG